MFGFFFWLTKTKFQIQYINSRDLAFSSYLKWYWDKSFHKGQLISKCPFGFIVWTKYQRNYRAWVSMGATGAWHPPKFWTSPLAPADFVVLNTNWHLQSSFYVTSGTLGFKFLTQAPLNDFLQSRHIKRGNSSNFLLFWNN